MMAFTTPWENVTGVQNRPDTCTGPPTRVPVTGAVLETVESDYMAGHANFWLSIIFN